MTNIKSAEADNSTIDIHIGEEPREIFLSYGLLSSLAAVVGNFDNIPVIVFDPELRAEVLATVLAERTKAGKLVGSLPDVDDIDISVKDAARLFEWISEHLVNFFAQYLRHTNKLMVDKLPEANAVIAPLSENGSAQ